MPRLPELSHANAAVDAAAGGRAALTVRRCQGEEVNSNFLLRCGSGCWVQWEKHKGQNLDQLFTCFCMLLLSHQNWSFTFNSYWLVLLRLSK